MLGRIPKVLRGSRDELQMEMSATCSGVAVQGAPYDQRLLQ